MSVLLGGGVGARGGGRGAPGEELKLIAPLGQGGAPEGASETEGIVKTEPGGSTQF